MKMLKILALLSLLLMTACKDDEEQNGAGQQDPPPLPPGVSEPLFNYNDTILAYYTTERYEVSDFQISDSVFGIDGADSLCQTFAASKLLDDENTYAFIFDSTRGIEHMFGWDYHSKYSGQTLRFLDPTRNISLKDYFRNEEINFVINAGFANQVDGFIWTGLTRRSRGALRINTCDNWTNSSDTLLLGAGILGTRGDVPYRWGSVNTGCDGAGRLLCVTKSRADD